MKTSLRLTAFVGLLGACFTLSSCVSPYAGPNEQNGAVVGALGGGALGAIIGNQSGRPLEGAAIGGLLGSLAGSSIGASQDQRFYRGGYYGVRQRPVYYRNAPYRYGPAPYRTNFYGGGYGFGAPVGFGYGRGYDPYCW